MSIIDPNSPGLFSFFAPKAGGPVSYPAMEMRRKIALQMLANSRKGYPKTLGEGLTAIGDAIGDRAVLNQLMGQESEFQKGIDTDYQRATGAPATTTPPASTPGPQSTLSPPPVTTAELTPAERESGVVGSEANALDAAAAPARTANVAGYRPAPAYLRAALEQNVPDPERRAYLGHLAGKEAQSASEVSSTGASGPFQFTRGTGRQYGLVGAGGDRRNDIAASIAAVNRFTDDNVATLTARLGRPPTPGEMALAHQQGAVTAARMLSGAGNASASSLAVNNVNPGASPQAAAAKIMGYYGMPGGGGGGSAPQTAQMTPQAGPLTTADVAGIDRLGDITGMGAGDRGYSYPPTASLGRQGDVQSDAPPLTGISPNVGAGVADTVQQGRDAVARARLQPPPAAMPPTGPTGPTAMASPAGNVVSDIAPAPPAAGTQLAQAGPPGAPRTAPFDPTVTPPPNAQLPEPIYPQIAPKSPLRMQNEAMAVRAAAMGDPQRAAMYKTAIDNDETQRQELFQSQVKRWEQDRALPQRQQELIKSRSEADIAARFGDPTTHAKLIEDTAKGRGVADASANALTNIYQAHKALQSAVVGSGANAKISFIKALDTLGYRGATSEAAASEIFKSLMAGNVAATIKETVGSQGISNADRQFGERAAGGDITMTREALERLLDISRRHHVNNINQHTDRLDRTFNDPVRDSAVRRAYSVEVPYLPGAVERLRANPNEADQFDAIYGRGQAKRLLERSQ